MRRQNQAPLRHLKARSAIVAFRSNETAIIGRGRRYGAAHGGRIESTVADRRLSWHSERLRMLSRFSVLARLKEPEKLLGEVYDD